MLRVVDLATAPQDGSRPATRGDRRVRRAARRILAEYSDFHADLSIPVPIRRVVTVDSVPDTLAELTERCAHWPHSSAVCDDVLRAIDPDGPTRGRRDHRIAGLLDAAGRPGIRTLARRSAARASMPDIADPVVADRDGDTLHIRFNRPQRHNAFSTDARAALLEALTVAQLDPSVTGIVLSGNGPSFCSGGDLAEFGTLRRPGERASGPHPAQPGAGARRAHRQARPGLPGRGARPGAGQRTGDGGVLRMG